MKPYPNGEIRTTIKTKTINTIVRCFGYGIPTSDPTVEKLRTENKTCGDTSCLVKNEWQTLFLKAEEKKCVVFVMPFRSISNVPHYKRVIKTGV